MVKRIADGRLYPAEPLTETQRDQVSYLAHSFCHRDGLSIRAAQQIMLESYGVRRSVGAIHKDLVCWSCSHCPEPEPDDPEPQESERVAPVVHQRPGGLTERQRDG